MISGLAGPQGEPSQSPYQVTCVRPASARNAATCPRSMKRSVSGTTTGLAPLPPPPREGVPGLVRDQIPGYRADVVVHLGDDAARFHLLPGVPGVPVLPVPHGRVPGLEREPAARREVAGQGTERRADVAVLQEQLEHVPGHDDQVEAAAGGQPRRAGLDPADPAAARPGPGQGQHRRCRVGARHVVPPARELAGELPRAAAHVEDPGRWRAGQAEIERSAGVGGIERVIQRRQPWIGVAGAGLAPLATLGWLPLGWPPPGWLAVDTPPRLEP